MRPRDPGSRVPRWQGLVSCIAAVALLVAACGPTASPSPSSTPAPSAPGGSSAPPAASPSAAAPAEIDHLTWAIGGNPPSLFVPRAWTTGTGTVMSLVQEGLLAFGQDLSLEPAVADTWEAKDAQTYVYHLRPGVKFSDGTPVTTDDVVFSMELNRDPVVGSQLMAFYDSVDTITATSGEEVTIKLKRPDAQFQYTTAHMAGFLVKKAQYLASPEDIGTPAVLPIGTGPYKLVSFAPSESVELERNDNYWGPKPIVKALTIKIIADAETRRLALQSGEVDGSFNVPLGSADQWAGIPGATVLTTGALAFEIVTMDVTKAPFDDIHARKAMWYLVDREGLVKAVLNGKGRPASAINPPEMWSGVLTPDEVTAFYGTLTPAEFSIDKAKAELAQSKTPDGFTLDLEVPNDDQAVSQVAQSIAENAKQIGITINVKSVDGNQYFADYNAHGQPLNLYGYSPDFADPVNYPWLFLDSANARKDGLNGSAYKNAVVDKAIDDAIQSVDPATRADAMKKAFTQIDADVPIVPIYWPDVAAAIGPKVQWDGFTAFWYNQPWLIRGLSAK